MLQKPHWTEGLELGSHHFQLLDRYHEELIAHRLEALFDHTWGIHAIRWDARAIGAGQLALQKLDAILPDGTPIACDGADGAATPAIPIHDLGPKNAREVYVGIRRLHAGANVGTGAATAERYVRETVLAPDLAGGHEPVRVECLRPNLQLLLEGEALQDFVTLPCARVVRAASGQIAFDETFVPPVLSVGASPYLRRELRSALDALLSRQALAARSSPRDVTEVVQRWLASIVGSFVPRIADLVHQRTVHPLVAYRVLAELLGALAPFTRAGTHRVPAFQYDHLGPVFAELFAGLGALLDAIGADHHRRIPLVRYDPSTLFADLNEPAIFRNDFFLRITGGDPDELRVRVPQNFKVASWLHLPEILRTATAGVPLKHEPRPPGRPARRARRPLLQAREGRRVRADHQDRSDGHPSRRGLASHRRRPLRRGAGCGMTEPVSTERIDRAIAQIDAQIGGIVDAVLHDEKFQALEAAWRGLAFVVERVDFQENIEVVVWSYSKAELEADFAEHADVTHTRFYRAVYTAEYGQHGGKPYGALFANWSASSAPAEIDLLGRIASVAAMAHAPVLMAAAARAPRRARSSRSCRR